MKLQTLMETKPELIEDSLNFSSIHVSMDAPFREEEANNLYDVMLNDDSLDPEEELMDISLRKEIERSLSTLGETGSRNITILFWIKWLSTTYFGRNWR